MKKESRKKQIKGLIRLHQGEHVHGIDKSVWIYTVGKDGVVRGRGDLYIQGFRSGVAVIGKVAPFKGSGWKSAIYNQLGIKLREEEL